MFYPIDITFQITDFFQFVLDRRFPENFNFDGEKHNFWEIVYVLDGKLEVTEDEKVYIMGEKDIIFHAPNEFHCLRSAENTCPHVLNVSFRINGSLPEHLKNGVLHLSSVLHDEYIEIVNMLTACDLYNKNKMAEPLGVYEVNCRMSAFFIRLLRESQVTDSLSTSTGAQTYRSLVELMHKEVYNNLSLEDLAKKSYISVSYIKKLFKHYSGISPKSYYLNLRVSEAQKLLLSDISISDITEKMNFSSASYFTIFFKNQTGYTPMQYRKMNIVG